MGDHSGIFIFLDISTDVEYNFYKRRKEAERRRCDEKNETTAGE